MNRKRLLAFSLIGCVGLLAASVGTTVAWFAGSSYLEYNNISVRITDKNIHISPDDETWFETLSGSDLKPFDKFKPVSSVYTEEWVANKTTTPEFRMGYNTAAEQFCNDPRMIPIANAGFFQQELYLKADSDVVLTIDPEKTSFKANEEKNKGLVDELKSHYPDLTKDQILENLNSIQESLRMSILVLNDSGSESLEDYAYYIVEPFKKGVTYYGGLLDQDENQYYDSVIVDDEVYEAVYGASSNTDKAVYDDIQETDSELVGRASVFNAKTEAGVHHFNLEKSLANGFEIVKENSIALEDANENVFIPLTANTSKKIVLSFYMEGWDTDNTNVTMYANFIISVSFMVGKTKA